MHSLYTFQSRAFTADISSRERLSNNPHLSDPYEAYFVRAARSGTSEDAGMGLFARGPILEGTVIAFYNGIRIEKTAEERREEENIQDDDEFEFKDSHRVRLTKDFDLDIPPGDRDLSQYSATIGHKV